MGRKSSFEIDIKDRHPFCPALSYTEWERLRDKIGLMDVIELGFRVTERDRMLRFGKKSVPKHRKNEKGLGWP